MQPVATLRLLTGHAWLKHEPDDRFGGIGNFGFLNYPNAYDCYACHYGVTFSQTDLAGQAARYYERFRPGESPRFLPRCAQDWSADIRQAVEEMLAATGGGGFPFASISFVLDVRRR
jgi:hypothetical protein